MTSITGLARELREITEWQRVPEPISEEEYESMIIYGIKTLYIDTGRANVFKKEMISWDDAMRSAVIDVDFLVDEEKYILLVAQIRFFRKVQSDVNNIVGYTTDALSVTNADKPYANLQGTIGDLEKERRIVYYKMVRYALGT